MSRIANAPVELPKGVEFRQDGNIVTLKGGNGELSLELNSEVELAQEDNVLRLSPRSGSRCRRRSCAAPAHALPSARTTRCQGTSWPSGSDRSA